MNYLKIVLQGYFNRDNREYLDQYFFEEFKKAERDDYRTVERFFEGCRGVIRDWENHLQHKVMERKRELYSMRNRANNGTLSYAEMEGVTTEQRRQETMEFCERELQDVRPDGIGSLSFTVHLFSLTNGSIAYDLPYNELLDIKLSIAKAFEKAQAEKEELPPQPTDKQRKPETKETELSERIKKHFGFFNKSCPRKHKQILNDADFKSLIDWTIWYFENDFEVPEILEPIKVVNTNKTFVQLAFRYLFKELHKSSPYPETLFEFYQSAFTPYSEDKKRNFEAVKNNEEVKKLMQIDH